MPKKSRRGQYAQEVVVFNNQGDLAQALTVMRDNLKTAAEEDRRRNWASEGVARFSELFRDTQDIDQLCGRIIQQLVKYMGANQGSMFLVVKTGNIDVELKLAACYAYNRKKYLDKTIQPGEGLVGQAYLEKEMVYLTALPENYITITSGLGEAPPRSLILIPLVMNDEVVAIIEMASFQMYEPYQIAFIQKVGEVTATAIANMQIHDHTRHLLNESRQMAETLRLQEEEIRQNMEELVATQEEMHRRMDESAHLQQELNARMNVLNQSALLTESDLYGTITYVNDKFCEVSKWRREEVMGKPHSIVRHPDNPKSLYKAMWETIKSGRVFRGTFKNLAKDGSTYWVDSTIAPVLNEDGKPVKYIGIRYDITQQVLKGEEMTELFISAEQQKEELQAQEEELRQNLEEISATQEELARQFEMSDHMKREMMARENVLNITTILSEADIYGNITYVNDKLCEVSQYSREELIGKPHNLFRHPDMPKELFKAMWHNIKKGIPFRGVVKNRAKDGSHYWVDAVISPVLDEMGKPVRYIGVRYVIPDDQLAEILLKINGTHRKDRRCIPASTHSVSNVSKIAENAVEVRF